MASRNDVTGDSLVSKTSNEQYRSNYDRIFGKKPSTEEPKSEVPSDKEKKD